MKKVFFCLLILMALGVRAQVTPTADVRVPDATTAFGVNISVGNTVYNVATERYYVCKTAALSTETLTTGVAKFNMIPTGYGTSGKVIKFTGTSTIGDGLFYDDGTNIGLGGAPSYFFDAYKSSVGTMLTSHLKNTDNTNAASHAQILIESGGASGGDPMIRFNTENNWNIGINNDNGDAFEINKSFSALGNGTVMSISLLTGAASFSGALTGSNLSGTNTGDQTITLTGDVTGTGTGSFATTVADDSHAHTGTTISGLAVADFASPNISNWTNDAGYITDGNTGWDNSYGFITGVGTGTLNTLTKWATTTTLGSSIVYDNGTNVGIGGTPSYFFDAYKSSIGATLVSHLKNTDNTNSASHALISVETGGNLGGDPYIRFATENNWNIGINNDNNDNFEINKSFATLGSGTVLSIAMSSGAATFTGALSASNLSGTNTGDQTITLTGDVTGSGTGSFATTVGDDSHAHTGSSISGLAVADFISPNISNWTNDAGYITDGNAGWDNSYGFITASGVTYENLSANGDIGTGATQVSQGNHTHNSLPVPGDTTGEMYYWDGEVCKTAFGNYIRYDQEERELELHSGFKISWMSDGQYISDNGAQLMISSGLEVSSLSVATTVSAEQYNINSSPASDHTASGITITMTAAVNLNFGDVCYVNSSGKLALVDADAISTSSGTFMSLASISADASGLFLMQGVARDDTWNWTVGGIIYISTTGTTGNTLTQTAPSGTGDVVQIVGVATHADRMTFNPNLVQVEIQ